MNTATDERDTALYVPTTSGLWSHSHDSEHDLMKRFLIEEVLITADGRPNGFNAVASAHTRADAYRRAFTFHFENGFHKTYRVRDNGGPWGSGQMTATPPVVIRRDRDRRSIVRTADVHVFRFTKWATEPDGLPYSITLYARNADEAEPRFRALFGHSDYTFYPPDSGWPSVTDD